MLVLTRKQDERIIILLPNGERIEIVVTGLYRHRNAVRIGIDAPKDITVVRSELVKK